jgi:hypothetical protein
VNGNLLFTLVRRYFHGEKMTIAPGTPSDKRTPPPPPPVPSTPVSPESKLLVHVRITNIEPSLLSQVIREAIDSDNFSYEKLDSSEPIICWSSSITTRPNLKMYWFDTFAVTVDQIRGALQLAGDRVGATQEPPELDRRLTVNKILKHQEHVAVLFVPRLEKGVARKILAEIHVNFHMSEFLRAIVLSPGGGLILHVPSWEAVEYRDDLVATPVGVTVPSHYPAWEALRGPFGLP